MVHPDSMPYDSTIYQGAAAHYRAGRPPYSPKLESFFAEELGLDSTARLLDVGCGPGILVVRLLEPGGMLALIVHTGPDRPRPPSAGTPIPHDEIKAIVEKYLGSTRRAGQGQPPVRNHTFEDVLARTRFGAPQSVFLPGVPDLLRDTESVVSGYFSLSWAAPHLFGEHAEAFAEEVRALLASRSSSGVFWDWPGDTEIIFARRPKPTTAHR
jgi:hypothetical protein